MFRRQVVVEKVHPDGNHEMISRFFKKKVSPAVQQTQQFEGIENAPETRPENTVARVAEPPSVGKTLYGYIVRNLMAKREQGVLLPRESCSRKLGDDEGSCSPQQVSPTALENNAGDNEVDNEDEDRDGGEQRLAEYLEYIAHSSDSDDNDVAISISSCSEGESDCD